jgi:hypothetical protein
VVAENGIDKGTFFRTPCKRPDHRLSQLRKPLSESSPPWSLASHKETLFYLKRKRENHSEKWAPVSASFQFNSCDMEAQHLFLWLSFPLPLQHSCINRFAISVKSQEGFIFSLQAPRFIGNFSDTWNALVVGARNMYIRVCDTDICIHIQLIVRQVNPLLANG